MTQFFSVWRWWVDWECPEIVLFGEWEEDWSFPGNSNFFWDKMAGKLRLTIRGHSLPRNKQWKDNTVLILDIFLQFLVFIIQRFSSQFNNFSFNANSVFFISNSRGVIERCVNVNVSLNVWLICKVIAWNFSSTLLIEILHNGNFSS